MFQAFEDNKPADWSGLPSLKGIPCWKNSVFETFEEAHAYALSWLGAYGEGVGLRLNEPWDYNGYGSMIEIREVKEKV